MECRMFRQMVPFLSNLERLSSMNTIHLVQDHQRDLQFWTFASAGKTQMESSTGVLRLWTSFFRCGSERTFLEWKFMSSLSHFCAISRLKLHSALHDNIEGACASLDIVHMSTKDSLYWLVQYCKQWYTENGLTRWYRHLARSTKYTEIRQREIVELGVDKFQLWQYEINHSVPH